MTRTYEAAISFFRLDKNKSDYKSVISKKAYISLKTSITAALYPIRVTAKHHYIWHISFNEDDLWKTKLYVYSFAKTLFLVNFSLLYLLFFCNMRV